MDKESPLEKPAYVSRAGKPAKQPGGGKAALKTGVVLKHFNAFKPRFDPHMGWVGWLSETDGCYMDALLATLLEFGTFDDSWKNYIRPKIDHVEQARQYQPSSEFMHYWLNQVVLWQGYAIYATAWSLAELGTRGTEFTHPHRQRIEDSDANRFRVADRAAAAAEQNWLKNWL